MMGSAWRSRSFLKAAEASRRESAVDVLAEKQKRREYNNNNMVINNNNMVVI